MFFYIHYILMTSGLSGVSVLLAVYFKTYSNASQSEIGVLLMTFPFVALVIKPLFCSIADRKQAHKRFMVYSLFIELVGYVPFAVIPFFPKFYEAYPRYSWYVLVLACHVGNGGLGVAWSLGDCLAMNMSQKNGTSFGRMRLMGTVSWGIYGFIIGQINEVPFLPKYVPAFLILLVSLIIEIVLVICWRNEDFEMVDPLQKVGSIRMTDQRSCSLVGDRTPNSMGCGTLRLDKQTAHAFREVLHLDGEDMANKLKALELAERKDDHTCRKSPLAESDPDPENHQVAISKSQADLETSGESRSSRLSNKNPQLVLLRMILLADGRVIKYIILFTVFGFLMAPMNFVFLSMEEICRQKGCNFSQLAGSVLISQASIETIAFLVVPFVLYYVSRSISLSFGYFVMTIRFFFYAGWYYTSDISPYWAVVGEWAHGISYGIFCIIQADVSLMFANESRLFIPELRKLGYLSAELSTDKRKIEEEERSIKMALRATMQALFGGFMDGLGQGVGALVCGLFVELYSYISLWQMFWVISFTSLCLHQLVELTKSRWSDTFEPRRDTKAYEIMQLTRTLDKSTKLQLTTDVNQIDSAVHQSKSEARMEKLAEGC